jgi:type IV pilus assembly protein PilN
MRIPLNLATQPFRRDRPILIASALVALLLMISLGVLASIAASERRQVAETQVVLDRMNQQIARIEREQAKIENAMRAPGNEEVLDRSVLFNALIKRKAISWTRIFEDIEKVLPHDVRVVSIRPQMNARDQVTLDMVVAAASPEPVIGFVAKQEGSDAFGQTAVSGMAPPTENDPFYRYRLSVNYAQKI